MLLLLLLLGLTAVPVRLSVAATARETPTSPPGAKKQEGIAAAKTMILQARQRAMETVTTEGFTPPTSPAKSQSDGISAANQMIEKAKNYARQSLSPVKSPAPARSVAYIPPAADDITGFLRSLDMEKYVAWMQSQGIRSLAELRECNPSLAAMKQEPNSHCHTD